MDVKNIVVCCASFIGIDVIIIFIVKVCKRLCMYMYSRTAASRFRPFVAVSELMSHLTHMHEYSHNNSLVGLSEIDLALQIPLVDTLQ